MPAREVPLSVLDVVPLRRGSTASEALKETLELARHVDALGYHRYWFAEHHGMGGIVSSAPALLIGQVAACTERLRVGSGGVMLPNHSPLVVAEQFGTLEALYPGRIDLGLGRAPGTDRLTARVLRRNHAGLLEDEFPKQLAELFGFFRGDFPSTHPYSEIEAVPARGNEPPVWLLGSSGYSAALAGHLGLPFAFAHHFSQDQTLPALAIYRERFRPSEKLSAPYAMIAAIVVVAETDAEAERLAMPTALSFLRLRQGERGPYPTLEEADAAVAELSPVQHAFIRDWFGQNIVGGPEKVKAELWRLLELTRADELMVLCTVPDLAARLRSYELLKKLHSG
jgi:luciferase family oxidoreductase group 1